MEKLKSSKKITMATLKSFAQRNKNNLFSREISSFSGMTDCVEKSNTNWVRSEIKEPGGYYQTGIQGVYTVGCSRDYFTLYEDDIYIGIEVYNSCGTTIIAVKK